MLGPSHLEPEGLIEEAFGPDPFLGSIPRALVALQAPSEVTSDSGRYTK